MNFKLEICADSVESAIIAQTAGADRVELCDNLYEGGTTPSFGTIASARENLLIQLHVLIRPRGGDFLYNDTEFDIMRRDIDLCGEAGVDGIVTGILRPDGSIDIERTQRLIGLAQPMSVTFHRAFDLCSDPVRGLEDIISTGASRLLTSGQKNKAPEGSELITKLVKLAGKRIIIMPGSGLDESNIAAIAIETRAFEFHLSGRKTTDSNMTFRREGIYMGGVPDIQGYSRKITDPEKILNIIKTLKMI